MILEKQLLPPINLGSFIRPFLNIKSTSFYIERDYSRGENIQDGLAIFPEVDIPASSPQGQSMQRLQEKGRVFELSSKL